MEFLRIKQEPDDLDARVTSLAPRATRVRASTPRVKQEPQDEADLHFHPSHSTINQSSQRRLSSNPNALPVASRRGLAPGGSRSRATYTPQPARSVPAGPKSRPKVLLDPFGRAIRGFPDLEEQVNHARKVRRRDGHADSRMPPAYPWFPSDGGSRTRLAESRCGDNCRGAAGSDLTVVRQLSKECHLRGFNLKWLPQRVSGPSFCYHVGLLHHVVKTDLLSDCDCRAKALVADKALDVVRTWPITKRAAAPDQPEHMLPPPNPTTSYRPGPLLADPRPADYYRSALPVPPKAKNTPRQEGGGSGNGRDVPGADQWRDAMADSRGGYTTAVSRGTKDGRPQEEAALLDHVRRVMGISLPEASPDTPAGRAFLEGLTIGARLAGVSPAAAAAPPSRDRSRSPLRRVGPDAHRHRSRSPLRRVGPDAHLHRSPLRERERLTRPPKYHRSLRDPSNSDHWDTPPGARDGRSRLEPGRLTPPPRYDRLVRDYTDLYEPRYPGNSCEADGKWLHDRYEPDEGGRRNYD